MEYWVGDWNTGFDRNKYDAIPRFAAMSSSEEEVRERSVSANRVPSATGRLPSSNPSVSVSEYGRHKTGIPDVGRHDASVSVSQLERLNYLLGRLIEEDDYGSARNGTS